MEKANKLPYESQMELARSEIVEERRALVCGVELFPEVVDYIVDNEQDLSVRQYLFVRSDSNVWATTLAKAARKEKDEFLLQSIALHLNTDVETLEFLAELNIPKVNWGLACNPNTKKERLKKLADINDNGINGALLKNPNTSKETYEKILNNDERRCWDGFYYYTVNCIKVVASGN